MYCGLFWFNSESFSLWAEPSKTEKMYKVDLPVDPSVENAVKMRRSAETARRARIFNTRLRVMGLDLDAINQQVQEKKHHQNMEKQRDKAFDKLREYHGEALLQQDIDGREKRAALHTDLTKYWATHQRVEDTRDADLQCGLKGAFRITIPEDKLGPASMTIFQGEDIGEEQRRREQKKKTDRDLRAQKEDNERRLLGDKHRGLTVSCSPQAAEQTETLKERHWREERENLAEMQHTLTSDMMTECAEAAAREAGGGSLPLVLVDRWRGMTPEQLSGIHREREEQRLERQRQREGKKIQDAACELQLLKLSREAEEEESRAEELRRQKRIQTDRYNMQLAGEQQAYQEYLNKKLYTNKPSKDYFDQFNTSSR
ncbi:RIB43A-like with coiled-coils protein 1 [Liparis tanakae]|uniref:RIB43A-like with coiled-coils protein 1 n=1 Tax=Liparis tanakae TaxID=230148 RepID=A0A4Z2GWK4_9TELE|nr:RIB43A-like with coiled-coils protein 1 [Liparis tanakae]